MIPPKYAQFTPPEADFFDFMLYFWCVFLTKSAKSDFLKKSSFKPKSSLVYRLTDWMAAGGVDTEPNVYFARPNSKTGTKLKRSTFRKIAISAVVSLQPCEFWIPEKS